MNAKNQTLLLNREIPVRHETQILVVGGGPAGVAAALAAAGQGRAVRLIEAHTCLGGMGTAGMVPAFMQFGDGENFLAGGVGRRILDAALAQGAVRRPGKGNYAIKAELLKRVYEDLLSDAGVSFTYHVQLIDVAAQDGSVRYAICAGKSGLFAVEAGVYVDCTGDGDLAAFAGAPYEKGDRVGSLMAGTLCSLWNGIDWKAVEQGGLGGGNKRIEEAIKDGVFTVPDKHLPGMWRVGEVTGGGNIGHTFGVDGTDEDSLTRAYVWGRKSLREYERYYKEYLKGFENMELVGTGSLMGVRETRRIMGDYVLSVGDFHSCAVFDDEIGRYSYPIDVHASRPDKESYEKCHTEFRSMRLGPGRSYGIPYRVLTPKGLKNVLVAGRCVSADRQMHGSLRVMPGCYITGQAAGVAAALMAETGADCHSVEARAVQTRLKQMGAFLPNFK